MNCQRKEQIGDAVLYLGDCLEVMPGLGKVDAVVTDPPYGVGHKRKTTTKIKLASVTYQDDYNSISVTTRAAIEKCLKIAIRSAVFSGQRLMFNYPTPDAIGNVIHLSGASHCKWGFVAAHNILFYGKCPYNQTKASFYRSRHPGGHITGEADIDHPCPKPLEWMKWLVDRTSLLDELVLDPFMGSGTTGVACAKLGRRFIGIEIEERYFEIACKRIEQAYRQPDLFIERPAAPVQEAMAL